MADAALRIEYSVGRSNIKTMDKKIKSGPSRRQVLAGAAATASLPAVRGFSHLAMRPKVILELTRNAATNSMRAVERVIWVAK